MTLQQNDINIPSKFSEKIDSWIPNIILNIPDSYLCQLRYLDIWCCYKIFELEYKNL